MEMALAELKSRIKSLPSDAREELFQYIDNGCEEELDLPDSVEALRRFEELKSGKELGRSFEEFIAEFEAENKG